MCEFCPRPGENNILLEIRGVSSKPGTKFEMGVAVLAKALGYDSESQQREVSPYRAVRDLEEMSKDRVERLLLRLYREVVSKWLRLSKASRETFVLNGRILLSPKTGKPLTKAEWAAIKRDILRAFNYIYKVEEERVVLHAISLGRVLKGMPIEDAVAKGYRAIAAEVKEAMARLESPRWRESVAFAQAHAGEQIGRAHV